MVQTDFIAKQVRNSSSVSEVINTVTQGTEHFDFEPLQSHVHRAFLVVMDYDPESLCITGQPELELSVLSG